MLLSLVQHITAQLYWSNTNNIFRIEINIRFGMVLFLLPSQRKRETHCLASAAHVINVLWLAGVSSLEYYVVLTTAREKLNLYALFDTGLAVSFCNFLLNNLSYIRHGKNWPLWDLDKRTLANAQSPEEEGDCPLIQGLHFNVWFNKIWNINTHLNQHEIHITRPI